NIRSYLRCEDCALISLRFKDGTIASIDCSWSRPDEWPIWGDVFLQIIGTDGCIVVDAFRSAVHYAGGGTPLTWASFGTNPDEEMIKHFVKVIEEDLEPRASGVDGRKALEIALAAYLSNERGRPIELPLR
ncbi:MAG: gfo/Idh/MocA family oxidoreductase, partial [Thermoprotei archaeon]